MGQIGEARDAPLDVGTQKQGPGAGRAVVDLRMQRLELLDRARSLLVGDEVAELSQDVGRRLDELLVRGRCSEVAQGGS